MSELKKRKEKLFSTMKNGYDRIGEADLAAMEGYCRLYRDYLDHGKTERECALYSVQLADQRRRLHDRRSRQHQVRIYLRRRAHPC